MNKLSIKDTRNTNIYEVVMYNTEVRQLVEFDESHPRWDDGWADSRYIELPAVKGGVKTGHRAA